MLNRIPIKIPFLENSLIAKILAYPVMYWAPCLCWFLGVNDSVAQPIAQKGFLDVRQYDFGVHHQVQLNGEWDFYFEQYLNDQNFDTIRTPQYIENPTVWNDYVWQGQPLDKHGFASYRLKVKIDPNQKKTLGIRLVTASTAYRLFVNDKKIGQSGIVGTSAETTTPQYLSQVYYLPDLADTMTFVLHVANFDYRKGGAWLSLEFGEYAHLAKVQQNSLFFDVFLCGAFLVMGLYHISLFYYRRKDKVSLFFSIWCLISFIRIISTGEVLITAIVPNFPFEIHIKMEYIPFFILPVAGVLYMRALYPNENIRILNRIFMAVGLLFVVPTLFLPSAITSHFINPFKWVTYAFILYMLGCLIWALRRKREGSPIVAFGFVVVFTTIFIDIAYISRMDLTFYVGPIGIFIFFFSQAFMISTRSSKSFIEVEKLSAQLLTSNENLESKVLVRTQEINLQKEEIMQTLDVVNQQRNEIQLKNKNIISSINYALRIQNAILTSEKQIQEYFPQCFVLFKAKDIVSGDFYWFADKGEKQIIAMADCTGHGVSGALMTMIGNNLLNRIVHDYEIHRPDQILNLLPVLLEKTLSNAEGKVKDGMDISIISIAKNPFDESTVVSYAGAMNPLYYVQDNKFVEIKADKIPVGGIKGKKDASYQGHELIIPKGKSNMSDI